MTHSTYVQQCINHLEAINNSSLEKAKIEMEIGKGSSARVFALGSVGTMPVCIKVLSDSRRPAMRLAIELKSASVITSRAPELQRVFPAFMGLLAIKDLDETIAIITEDASRLGTIPVNAAPTTLATKDALYRGFSDKDARGLIRPEELEESVAFMVNGEERWLDLTPSPINLYPPRGTRMRAEFESFENEIHESITELTCTISPDSVLAQSIDRFI